MLVSKAFNVRRLAYSNPSNEIASPHRHVGIEIEVENARGVQANASWNGWETHTDHSLRNNGIEFVTPPVYGEDLVRLIRDFCQKATEAGFTGAVRTGTHIHVNMSHSDVGCLEYVVGVYAIFEPALFRIVGEWRKWSNFCAPLSEATGICTSLRKLFAGKTESVLRHTAREMEALRYSSLNLASLAKYGTIEFRIFPTSFAPHEIILWINLVLLMVEYGELLHQRGVSPADMLSNEGITNMATAVFGKRPECLQVVLAYIKPKDEATAISLLTNCSAVTSELLDGAVLEDFGAAAGKVAPAWPDTLVDLLRTGQNPMSWISDAICNNASTGLKGCKVLQRYKDNQPKKKPQSPKKVQKKQAPLPHARLTSNEIVFDEEHDLSSFGESSSTMRSL